FPSSPGPCHFYNPAIAECSARADPVPVGRSFNSLISTQHPSSLLRVFSPYRYQAIPARAACGVPAEVISTSASVLLHSNALNPNQSSLPFAPHRCSIALVNERRHRPPQQIVSHSVQSYLRRLTYIDFATLNSFIQRQAPLLLVAQPCLFSLRIQASGLPN
ncbi:hypothetical protein CCUS01_16135, partial [Colletotrichum cuscutae]